MARQLLQWVQMNLAIGDAGRPRVLVGTGAAVDATNYAVGRRWDPDHAVDVMSLEKRMAAVPPRSLAEFFALVCAEVSEDIGVHVDALEPAPPPPDLVAVDGSDPAPLPPGGGR